MEQVRTELLLIQAQVSAPYIRLIKALVVKIPHQVRMGPPNSAILL